MRFLLLGLFLFALGACSEAPVKKQDSSSNTTNSVSQATVIVDFGNGDPEKVFIQQLSSASISGLELLRSTELPILESGDLICKIGEVGCSRLKCLGCGCPTYGDPDCRFWSYWHLQDGKWEFSQVGAGDYSIEVGAIDAWKWGNDKLPPTWMPQN